ncbi:MAG: phosphoribosylglycinamide formyltransferase [Oscillospiraceae bacterium]|jgi:phosphoribosylglycinamide formyltransferase-1|nr:phosphoribosylglycinamide formyltransferase [Oscillospiraceae bacterium]
MKNILVLVSGGGTNLQKLIDAQDSGILRSGRIALVVSSKPGVYALERASRAGIPAKVLPRQALGLAAFEDWLLTLIAEYKIDFIVLAGFLTILSAGFVKQFPRRIINVHPALLPAFGGKGFYGLRVHEAALARGVKLSGATIHFVNEVCDGGEIIAQKAVPVLPGDTPESLQLRIMEEAEWVLLPEAVEAVCQGTVGSEQ